MRPDSPVRPGAWTAALAPAWLLLATLGLSGGACGGGHGTDSGSGGARAGDAGGGTGGGSAPDGNDASGGAASGGQAGGTAASGGGGAPPGGAAGFAGSGAAGGNGDAAGRGGSGAAATGGAAASGGAASGGTSGACASSADCAAPLVCERSAGALCLDPDWAEWPMPNDATSGAPNRASYTDGGDDTVTDGVTGLMWQKTVSTRRNVWDDAVTTCQELALAGHHDWRLPTRIELVSLTDLGKTMGPTIDVAFPDTPAAAFWTASQEAADPTFYAWTVSFYDGLTALAEKVQMQYARCVR